MLRETQPVSNVGLTPGFEEHNLVLTDVVPNMSQLLDNSKLLRTRPSEPTLPPPYPESAYQWLVETLESLIEFVCREGDCSVPELTKNDYDWIDAILEELIYSVDEGCNHPLSSLMEFVCLLIADYEDKYVPKLTERFPELAEENPPEIIKKNNTAAPNPPKLDVTQCAAHAFFSVGCFLWEGSKAEKALSAYDTAIRLKPDYAEVYNNRGNIKNELGSHDAALADYNEAICLNPHFSEAYYNRAIQKVLCEEFDAAIVNFTEAIRLNSDYAEAYAHRGVAQAELGNIDEARSDIQTALALSERQGNPDFKVLVEKWLQRLEQVIVKHGNHKQPRPGGQWKGKVKMTDDFDELPESFIEGFHGDDK